VLDGGKVVAAVCLSGPIERLGAHPARRYAKRVVAAAQEIHTALATSHQ
jgi:DNA-binding IclR family transcriptional regulator